MARRPLVPLLVLLALPGAAAGKNGFDLSDSAIPTGEIRLGGPARDGIPALFDPSVRPARDAPWADDDLVLAIAHAGEARAYPVAILDWHELVNDTLGGDPVLVTYCPLCGTGLVFDRRIDGASRSFGVSGLLYLADVLFYDRESESLWSQIHSRAVTGPARGTRLRMLRSEMALWGEWKRAHPRTTVLSRDTGHTRDYNRSPYAGYSASERLLFPTKYERRYSAKMPTIGMRLVGGPARAYPAVEIARAGGTVREKFEGRDVRVSYDPEAQIFEVEAPDDVEVIEGYWFAWSAFHPDTTTYVARKQ
jgi:hypothetical protein